MGRYYYDKRDTVEDTRTLDINWLMRVGGFDKESHYYNRNVTWTRSGMWGESKNSISYEIDFFPDNPRMRLYYTVTDRNTQEKKDFDYMVPLTTTPCNFGGVRYWFRCPNQNCQRRVGTLYFGQKHFLCRKCLNLAYESQNENRRYKWDALRRMWGAERKAEELYKNRCWQTQYAGKPTKRWLKYQAFMEASNVDAGRWLMMEKALRDV